MSLAKWNDLRFACIQYELSKDYLSKEVNEVCLLKQRVQWIDLNRSMFTGNLLESI